MAGWLTIVVLGAACARTSSPPPGAAPRASPLVDPSEIVAGGPPRDGIPPIDHPKFVDPSAVDWLSPREPVIAIDLNGDARAYPAQIIVWHEIVNDVVGEVPVTITYCPLCNTGIAFGRPTIDGELLDFGTSGKLYKSNLVMYDRQTDSLWPQVLGQAVIGPLAGTRLELIPIQMVSWGDWKARFPRGKVLSRDTGEMREYGTNPYEGYDSPDTPPFLFKEKTDPRIPAKSRVVGVRVGSDVMAFPYRALYERKRGDWSVLSSTVGGRPVVVFWRDGTASAVGGRVIALSHSVGATGVFDPRMGGRVLTFRTTDDGIVDAQTGTRWDIFGRAIAGPFTGKELNRVVSIESFWFNWAAFYPETRIFGL